MVRLTKCGPVMQIAYVTENLESALAFWTQTMGVGPFFLRQHVKFDRVLVRGEPSRPDFSMALAYWGNIQIELIEQHDTSPSIYADWRAAGLQGVQHLCVMVDDMVSTRTLAQQRGGSIVQEVFMPGGAGEAIYVDFGGGPGTMIEYLQLKPELSAGFDAMRLAAADWDGQDPIRR